MKPGDFLLGVLDFFAILLPGSLATWLLTRYIPADALRRALSFGLEEGQSGPDRLALAIAFLLFSYMLGHFVFMAGAKLDPLYDTWRRRTKPTSHDRTYQAARKVHERLANEIAGGDFSTFKWAKAYIQVEAAQARVEIDRLEADSKFFRSLVVVSIALAAHFLLRERAPAAGVAAIVMAVLSYARYMEQRWKMTELTYAMAVIVDAAKRVGTLKQTADVPTSET
jgi:hypothetical protein